MNAPERLKNIILDDNTDNDQNYFNNCFYEVTLTTSLSFIFSLPATLSFSPNGIYYSTFSTFSSLASSALTCASSNKKIISPSPNSFSAKLIPYLVDLSVGLSTINSLSLDSFYSLPEAAINIKKISFILSAVVSADQITKAAVEMAPNYFFESIDSLLGLASLNTQNEVNEGFYNFG